MKRFLMLVAAAAALLAASCDAGHGTARRTAKHSARAQARLGMGHHVRIPNGYHEGVGVASGRQAALNGTCYANEVPIASAVVCRRGTCHASNVYQ